MVRRSLSILFIFCSHLLAQVIELPCPVSTQVIPVVGQTRNASTSAYRQWLCVDANGNVTIQPQTVIQPPALPPVGIPGPSIVQTATMYSGFRATANGEQVINYFGSGVSNTITGQSNNIIYPGTIAQVPQCNAVFTCQYLGNNAFQFTPTASTSTVVGAQCCSNANSGNYPILSWNKVTFRASFGTSGTITNSRFWFGLSVFANASSLGINGTGTIGTTAYAQDLPNKTTVGWRCNPSTNLDWMAVQLQANNSGVISSIIDTGKLCTDFQIHTWDMTLSPDSSTITWFIDGVQVAQAANIINVSVSQSNVLDIMSQLFYTGDNKNTVTGPSMNFFYAVMLERQ